VPGVVDTANASIRFTLTAARMAELDPTGPGLSDLPEAGFAALLPLAGLAVGGLLFWRRRRSA
jgi:hypothetical protein